MEQADILRYVIQVLESQQIPYMLVGSLASGVFGDARMTRDIDMVIDVNMSQVETFCAAFPLGDFYVSLPAVRDAVARESQFNVIHPRSGNKVDFIVAKRDAWGREQLTRRRAEWILPELRGYVASPEDIILGKLLYYREGEHEKHLRDIVAMLQISASKIDQAYIQQWAVQLDLMDAWRIVLVRFEQTE